MINKISVPVQIVIYVTIFIVIIAAVLVFRWRRNASKNAKRLEDPEDARATAENGQVPQIVVTSRSPYSVDANASK